MTNLIPYLNFPGTTEEAMEFYHSIFGGVYGRSSFAAFGALPADHEHADATMHAQLVSDAIRIMAADHFPGLGPDVTPGDNISLALVGPDDEELTGYFNRLSEGGTVVAPLETQIWGDKYGALVDKFGIHWMVNVEFPKDS